MNKYNGSELFGMHYNIFPGCCCCIRPTYIVAVRQVTMSFTCVVLRHSKGQKKEQQSLSKAHYFYFKINIISKSTTAFVLTRI